jgi:hypothetical protein
VTTEIEHPSSGRPWRRPGLLVRAVIQYCARVPDCKAVLLTMRRLLSDMSPSPSLGRRMPSYRGQAWGHVSDGPTQSSLERVPRIGVAVSQGA